MFNFLKKEELKVVACVDGTCINIADVKDQVFSAKMMGDGFAIIPTDDTIVSPISGTIETVFPTNHAVGIKNRNGVEVLIHIGLDTVELNGEGFTGFVKEGTQVKAGQPLVKIERTKLEEKGYDLSTMIIFTAGFDGEVKLECYGKKVKAGDVLINNVG